jgi:hypothetical protein
MEIHILSLAEKTARINHPNVDKRVAASQPDAAGHTRAC